MEVRGISSILSIPRINAIPAPAGTPIVPSTTPNIMSPAPGTPAVPIDPITAVTRMSPNTSKVIGTPKELAKNTALTA